MTQRLGWASNYPRQAWGMGQGQERRQRGSRIVHKLRDEAHYFIFMCRSFSVILKSDGGGWGRLSSPPSIRLSLRDCKDLLI